MTDSDYLFRCRCTICRTTSDWSADVDAAREWRQEHFAAEHPENPMVKVNSAIQRYPADEVEEVDA